MKTRRHGIQSIILVASVGLLATVMAMPTSGIAQGNQTKKSSTATSLVDQIRELQTKVAKLEAALKQKHAGQIDSGMQGRSMQGMGKKGGMGMASMSGKGMSGMGKMSDKKGMMSGQGMGGKGMAMMGQMKGMGKMQMPSTLPGFAGASHIYHIGATSFFLDHSQHITLTQEQQVKLNQIKEKVLLGQATFDRWISQAEQELWVLTSSDKPDATKVEAKIREIEKLRSDKRIDYIRAVGDSAKILTNEQRQTLVGYLPPEHATSAGK